MGVAVARVRESARICYGDLWQFGMIDLMSVNDQHCSAIQCENNEYYVWWWSQIAAENFQPGVPSRHIIVMPSTPYCCFPVRNLFIYKPYIRNNYFVHLCREIGRGWDVLSGQPCTACKLWLRNGMIPHSALVFARVCPWLDQNSDKTLIHISLSLLASNTKRNHNIHHQYRVEPYVLRTIDIK